MSDVDEIVRGVVEKNLCQVQMFVKVVLADRFGTHWIVCPRTLETWHLKMVTGLLQSHGCEEIEVLRVERKGDRGALRMSFKFLGENRELEIRSL